MAHKDRAAPLAACAILSAYGVVALSEGAFDRLGRERDPLAARLPGTQEASIHESEGNMRSGTRTKVATLAGACALCGLLTVAQAEDPAKGGPPHLSGRWELVPDKSDGAQGAIDALLGPLAREGEEGRTPMAGGPPPGGAPGDAGDIGGGRGGRGGRGGWGGAPAGGPGGGPGDWRGPRGDGDFRPPTDEERAAIRDAVEAALTSPVSMAVVQDGTEIALTYPDGRARHFYTDGRKFAANRVSRKAKWKNDTLVVETEAGRIKIKETFQTAGAGQLTVRVQAKHPRYDGEVALTRVYKKTAE